MFKGDLGQSPVCPHGREATRCRECEKEDPERFESEDYLTFVLEGDDESEIAELMRYKNLTPEQLALGRHYARLRRSIIDAGRAELESKSEKTANDVLLGIDTEYIERPVRDAVLAFARAGYKTYSSGFVGVENQHIWFSEDYWEPEQLKERLHDLERDHNITFEIEPNAIQFTVRDQMSEQDLTQLWTNIADRVLEKK